MKIGIGCYVELYDCIEKRNCGYEIVQFYTLPVRVGMKSNNNSFIRDVSQSEGNGRDKISDATPLGKNLMGKSEGQIIEYESGGTLQRFEIIHVYKDRTSYEQKEPTQTYADDHVFDEGHVFLQQYIEQKRIVTDEMHDVTITLLHKDDTPNSCEGSFILYDKNLDYERKYTYVKFDIPWVEAEARELLTALNCIIKTCKVDIFVSDKLAHALMVDDFFNDGELFTFQDETAEIIGQIREKLCYFPYRFIRCQ